MNLPEVVVTAAVGKITEKALEKVSPLLRSALPDQPSAFDQWMTIKGNQRLEILIQKVQDLEAENQSLKQTITNEEKISPGSGHTKALQEYITTPLEEKVELLQNALLNGMYGDYTLELREDLYRLITELQPVDIVILKYLTEQCPSLAHLERLVSQQSLENAAMDKIVASTSMYYYSHDKVEGPKQQVGGIEQFCCQNGIPEQVEKRALDRLRAQALIFNPIPTMDFSDPYAACIPTQFAQEFLKFITEPDLQPARNV